MQTLYTLSSMEQAEQANKAAAARILNDKLDQVLDLFTVAVLYTIRIAQYADIDSRTRAARYLPSEADRNVDTRIAENTFVVKMLGNATFNERIKKEKLERYIDEEWVKKIYQLLEKSNEYAEYTTAATTTPQQEKDIIQHIWEKEMLGNENMTGHFVDELPGWEDDGEIVTMLMQHLFKNMSKINFTALLSGEKKEYATDLLAAVIEKSGYCMELIEPRLKNWDKERVALIDLILLRMGVCELLYFPTIPTKVTINEYIDVAKQYSTPQSGQFVNGVLDNILKSLVSEDKIQKQERPGKS